MNKWLIKVLILYRFFFFVNNIKNLPNDPSLNMILINDTCFYVSESSKDIYKIKVEEDNSKNFSTTSNVRNKTLIKLSEEQFMVFGLNNNSYLIYKIFNVNENNHEKPFENLALQILGGLGNHTIKPINKTDFLVYFIYSGQFYLYQFNLFSSSQYKGGRKDFDLEKDYGINTIECDSFDGKNIFCVYSTIKIVKDIINYYGTLAYYSFGKINDNTLEKNEINVNIGGPSLLKIEYNNNKKFLICYYEFFQDKKNPLIYCQFFTQIEDKIISEPLYYIGTTKYTQLSYANVPYQSVVKLINYNWTIFIHLTFQTESTKVLGLFTVSIDLNLIISYYVPIGTVEKKSILVNDKYIIFLDYKNEAEVANLEIQCPNKTLYDITDKKSINLLELSLKAKESNNDDIYLSFGLEPLTYIFNNNKRNMGGTFNKFLVKEEGKIKSDIELRYNENLKITYNYYIYHSSDESDSFPAYTTYSNFCLLKVKNCYESCKTCDDNIEGTQEVNQCLECKDNYNKFVFNLEGKSYINCLLSNDSIIKNHYFLDANDGQYYKCDESCLTCNNNKSCTSCNDGYYRKEDDSNGLCFNDISLYYYLDNTQQTFIYKKCYKTCLTCFGSGNERNNMCIDCNSTFVKYPYDSSKCTTNHLSCNNYWLINSTDNIQCIDHCDDYIIHEGDNMNQCVKNCTSYKNPLSIWTSNSLLFYTCDNLKYCITLSYCKLKRLNYNDTTSICERGKDCLNMSDFSVVTEAPIITTILDVETTNIIITTTYNDITPYTTYVKEPEPILERTTIVKYFEFKKNFTQIEKFVEYLVEKYIDELVLELDTHTYLGGIDFITVNDYEDFFVTVYPLHKEDYLYKYVLKTNNLGYVNFNNFFEETTYIKQNSSIILVGLIEFKNINIPVNSINYFFFQYEEDKDNDYKPKSQPQEIPKVDLINNSTFFLTVEYPLYNYNNSNISEVYSLNLITTIKTLNILDQKINFYDNKNEFYNDICIPFTSEIETDMTLIDRAESYSIQISLCENGCQLIDLIDKGREENPRAICECQFKERIKKSDDNYTFIYDKTEGKDVSNINALKCGKTVFKSNEIENNFIFWIYLFLIFILIIILLSILFCGKSSIEDTLKIKKEIEEDKDSNNKGSNIYNISEKISSINSEAKFQSINVKEIKNSNNDKEIISSKISYAAPPPKRKLKDIFSTDAEKHSNSKGDNDSIDTTLKFNKKIELKFKNDEEQYDEIFPDYDEVLNNNYYESKYMKNNYINLRLTNLKIKKYFLVPLEDDELYKHINTDTEDNSIENNNYKNKSKKRIKTVFNYYKNMLPKAEISYRGLRNNYKIPSFKTESDINNINKNFFKESISFDDHNKTITLKNKANLPIKNSNENADKDDNNIFIHKKKRSVLSSENSNNKKSDLSSSRPLNKSQMMDKYFLSSSNNNINITIIYTFLKFYWIYLNKREFYLISIYNLQDNIASFIRIPTFIFVISLFFTLNCIFLTSSQIHERHIYKKEKGSLNEFTYIFKKESDILFILVLIYIVIKMLFIKLIYGKLFKISFKAKEELSPFGNIETEKEDNPDKNIKRKEYLKKYRRRSLVYIIIILVLLIIMGYFSICYFGIFKNTRINMIIRFVISFVFSIIFCLIICLIIVIIYHFGRKKKNNCLKITYKILNFIY